MTETIKQRIQSALVNPINHMNTELIIVMETGRRLSQSKFVKQLNILNAMVNKSIFGRTFTTMARDDRVMMTNNIEQTATHTHSHVLIRMPIRPLPNDLTKYDVVNLMRDKWNIFNDKFIVGKKYKEDSFDNAKDYIYDVYCEEDEDEEESAEEERESGIQCLHRCRDIFLESIPDTCKLAALTDAVRGRYDPPVETNIDNIEFESNMNNISTDPLRIESSLNNELSMVAISQM